MEIDEFRKDIALAIIELISSDRKLSALNIARESGYTIRDIEFRIDEVTSAIESLLKIKKDGISI